MSAWYGRAVGAVLDHTDVVEGLTEAVPRTPMARALLVLDGDHLEQLAVRGSDDVDHHPRPKRPTRSHVQKGTCTLTRLSPQHNSSQDIVPRSVGVCDHRCRPMVSLFVEAGRRQPRLACIFLGCHGM